ncbi:outer membrane protein assembly factor BamB [Paraburkholderia caledonica]|uniref:Outer membrane protein assembly factor BamB n=1 Tax=Paraburkholderia caledonica TaxID=134536 RepID=A0AB73ISE1_9BURK|nr:outer membrane protein assembly factor BamB [Paraburkholderia caledonica]
MLFGSYDGNLYALDVETGKELWRNVEADWIGSSPCVAPDLGLAFVGLEHAAPRRAGAIAAIDISTGVKRWEVTTYAFVHASPQYEFATGALVCGTNDGSLIALDAATGEIRWQVEVGASIKHAPAIDTLKEAVVVGAFDGTIRCFDLRTGTARFTVQTGNTVYTTPLIDGGRIYCGSTDQSIYVIDLASGSKIASIPVSAKVFSPPKRVGDWIWFGATDGRVRALDPVTLAIVSDTQLSESITCEFGYDTYNDRLVVVTNGGCLHSFSVINGNGASSPRRRDVARERLSAIALARLTAEAFIHRQPLPDPAAFEIIDETHCSGAFASLRDRRTGQRIARAGFWVFDEQLCSSAQCIIVATAKTCEAVSPESLKHVDIGLTMIGNLERVTLGELNSDAFGVVVRDRGGKHIGGALPNSPEFANESGQYLHALRNANLDARAPHELYRHDVRKYVESETWPPFGSWRGYAFSSDLEALVAWLSGLATNARVDHTTVRKEVYAVALTHYMGGRVASVLHRMTEPQKLLSCVRSTLRQTRENGREASQADGGVVLSVLLRGKRLPGAQQIGNRTMRIASDALVRIDGERELVHLPMLAMQRNMAPSDVEIRLRGARTEATSSGDTANWEICPCKSWLLGDTGPVLLEGALTRPDIHLPHVGMLLDATLRAEVRRIDELTAERTIYLPVTDMYIAAQNGNEQYIAWLAAVSAAAKATGLVDAHVRCVERIDAFIDVLDTERSRWQSERRAALRALMACSSARFDASADQIRGIAELRVDALAICVLLKEARRQARGDLREWCSPVAAGLDALGRYQIGDGEWWAQAANELVVAGHERLRSSLLRAAQQIASTQLPASGAFVPAMNVAGPTAATATLTLILSTALATAHGEEPICSELTTAWRGSLSILDALRIREADAFCLKAPARALNAIRDEQGSCVVSAQSCAAVLAACAHALSIGLDGSHTSGNITPGQSGVVPAAFGTDHGIAELDR